MYIFLLIRNQIILERQLRDMSKNSVRKIKSLNHVALQMSFRHVSNQI